MKERHIENLACVCHCHNNHEGRDGTNGKANCKCLPNCEHCVSISLDKKDWRVAINPIQQRCETVSGDHHFKPMHKVGYYYGDDGKKFAQDQVVYLNGKRAYQCEVCDLVDDVYEGKYN